MILSASERSSRGSKGGGGVGFRDGRKGHGWYGERNRHEERVGERVRERKRLGVGLFLARARDLDVSGERIQVCEPPKVCRCGSPPREG